MSDHLAALRMFVRVAHTGSFSKAGKELSLSQSAASRSISALEREVGAELFTRTTRAVVLTSSGAEYLARIEPILHALDEAAHLARGSREVRGVLRVALPYSIALREVIPRLPAFVARNPAVRIELLMDDQPQDLVREGIDVAVRLGISPSPGMIARQIGTVDRLVAASPEYLNRAGIPTAPNELSEHSIVVGPVAEGRASWTFRRAKKTVTVKVNPVFRANANEGAIAAAVAGLGIVSTGSWGCRAHLERGELVKILNDWTMSPPAPVYVVLPAGRATKAAGRAFIDYLVASWHH